MGMIIRARRINPDDAERLRAVRLAALADAPMSFWQTLAGESARPSADWRAHALRNSAGDTHATFLLERDDPAGYDPERDDGPMGMVDVYQPSLAPEFRELAALWVAPAIRGTGAADTLLDTAVGWARTAGAIGVRLWVVPTNTAAVRIYTRHGFTLAGGPEPDTDDPAGKVYVPMLLMLDSDKSARQ
ncbi:GNAT family N-acetyltransferase [Frankia sp. CiP3]|uniref:GNAT family N-acetyltransferase n=1 Tax=Frankia sp. CiP3 TaxID=2880971 RepID=UPI001EF5CD7A|nr:GNAT family N-acetyltransferase [Frankia sp. CiP3]